MRETVPQASLCFIINPRAGRGQAGRVFAAIARGNNLRFIAYFTHSADHTRQLAVQVYREGFRRIVVIGGDGTLNEVINGLPQVEGVTLGLIPCGRGNDWARQLGLPLKWRKAWEVVLQGRRHRLDLAQAGRRVFCTVACAGLAAEAAAEAGRLRLGRLSYLAGLARALRRYQAYELELDYDGGSFRGEVVSVAVGNTATFGGGLSILPRASVQDGLLDVCLVEALPRWRFVSWLPSLFWGGQLDLPYIRYFQAREVRLKSSLRLSLYADGEPIQSLPVTISTLPRRLSFLVP